MLGQNQTKWGIKQPVEPVHTLFQKGHQTASQADPDEFCPNTNSWQIYHQGEETSLFLSDRLYKNARHTLYGDII